MARYRYYYPSNNTVVCVSTFAQKNVRGVAYCSAEDTFNKETGERLARMRCDKIIANKRRHSARKKLETAREEYNKAKKNLDYFMDYFNSSNDRYDEACVELEKLERVVRKTETKPITTTSTTASKRTSKKMAELFEVMDEMG